MRYFRIVCSRPIAIPSVLCRTSLTSSMVFMVEVELCLFQCSVGVSETELHLRHCTGCCPELSRTTGGSGERGRCEMVESEGGGGRGGRG